jgi:hypothetical protein
MKTENCQRCNNPTNNVTTMSMFNTQIICIPCKEIERKHPLYNNASMAEMDEIKKGNFNFEGIGLPKDL